MQHRHCWCFQVPRQKTATTKDQGGDKRISSHTPQEWVVSEGCLVQILAPPQEPEGSAYFGNDWKKNPSLCTKKMGENITFILGGLLFKLKILGRRNQQYFTKSSFERF